MSPEALSEYQGKNVSRHQRIILSQLWGAWRTFSSWRLATYPSMTNSKVVYTISGPTTSRYSTWARIRLLGGGRCFGQLVHNNYLFGHWWMRTRLHFCPNILVAYKDIIFEVANKANEHKEDRFQKMSLPLHIDHNKSKSSIFWQILPANVEYLG